MIVINNLDKYYNKGKPNEIHVIDQTSLVLPDKGLVCFLGPSGCGKTTLLNVIGGMDTADSGLISYDGTIYTKEKKDAFRASNMGFVFQNYILFPEKSVYDNLRIVLNMFNISEDEINSRIDYALKAVNMANYQKRLVRQLSGGQMQRIAIARALVKSPKLIIADEPTGNLDEKNTNQIMNILKKLSQECLIVMVTHEKRLADFYSDRIIKILDGKIISDEENVAREGLVEKDEVNIYLGELDNTDYSIDDVNIKYFFVGEKPKLKLDIVYKNDTIYFRTSTDDPKIKFKLLDNKSETILVDGKKPELKIEDVVSNDYEMPKIDKKNIRNSVVSFKEALRSAWEHLKGIRIKQRLMLIVFFVSAVLIVISIGFLGKALILNDFDFMNSSRNLILVKDTLAEEKIKQYEKDYNQSIAIPMFSHSNMTLIFDLYRQGERSPVILPSTTLLPLEYLEESDLLVGNLPKNDKEIVLDKWLINRSDMNNYFSNRPLTESGLNDYNQLIGCEVIMCSSDYYYTSYSKYDPYYQDAMSIEDRVKIVGISDLNDDIGFVTKEKLVSFSLTLFFSNMAAVYLQDTYNYLAYSSKNLLNNYGYQKKVCTVEDCGVDTYFDFKGNEKPMSDCVLKDGEVIINYTEDDTHNFFMYGKSYKVVGYVNNNYRIICNNETQKQIYYEMITNQGIMGLYCNDKTKAIKNLVNQEFYDVYKETRNDYNDSLKLQNTILIIFTAVILVVALVFLFFTIRSSMISRIYEVGVYRSLGVRKFDIFRLFACEIMLMLLFSSILGYLAASIVITKYSLVSIMPMTLYNWYSWIVSLVIILVINFFVGLLPVGMLLKLTPSEIISKYDI